MIKHKHKPVELIGKFFTIERNYLTKEIMINTFFKLRCKKCGNFYDEKVGCWCVNTEEGLGDYLTKLIEQGYESARNVNERVILGQIENN